jgi:hypothetical protein
MEVAQKVGNSVLNILDEKVKCQVRKLTFVAVLASDTESIKL